MKTFEITNNKTNEVTRMEFSEEVTDVNVLKLCSLDEKVYTAVDHSTTAKMAADYGWKEQKSFTVYVTDFEDFENEEARISHIIEEVIA